MTKDDFVNWKNNEVSRLVFAMQRDLIERTQDTLGGSAGLDPLQDRFLVGYIKGLQEILNASVEEVGELEID